MLSLPCPLPPLKNCCYLQSIVCEETLCREKEKAMPRAVMGVAVPPEVAEQLQAQQMADNAAELAGLQLDNPEVHLPRARS